MMTMMEVEAEAESASEEKDGLFELSAEATFRGFDGLCVETLSNVLSYCDFQSAHQFARATNQAIRQTLYEEGDQANFLWKELFRRHHFSPEWNTISPESPMAYIRETQQRRQLSRNLLLPRAKKGSPVRSCCFNLPNRCFYFVPITPEDHFHQWDDPPPVDFGCDSFILTSTASGGELVTLDPFHGVLKVYENCLQNSVANDEAMLMDAMLKAANIIGGSKTLEWDEDMPEEQIAGEVFEQSVYRNHNIDHYKKPPFQVLFRMEDNIEPSNYFPYSGNDEETMDIECGYHGIDSKTILKHGEIVGTMVAVGRMFTKETTMARGSHQDSVCTELITWSRWNQDRDTLYRNQRNQPFGDRKVCRFPCSFKTIDLCPVYSRVYATFVETDGLVTGNPNVSEQGAGPSTNCSTIVVYPMMPYPAQDSKATAAGQQCDPFPVPEFYIQCQAEVSSLAVDPTGTTLVVGTTNGTCEVWSIVMGASGAASARRSCTINIKSAISNATKHTVTQKSSRNCSGETGGVSRMRRALPAILDGPRITSFHYSSHLPLSDCGFVTLHHSSSDGSSLLLWQKSNDSNDDFRIVSMINLPLSSSTRAPRLFYDGRRILVYGSDHIGMIILVYHVLSSNEDIIHFQGAETKAETSGGVYNFTFPTLVRFANRIRHAALGGLQYYDSIHMTCNERYIIVNTKTGNCLTESACPYADGLLVIDLQD